jgi:hypothetical protein
MARTAATARKWRERIAKSLRKSLISIAVSTARILAPVLLLRVA